MAGTIDIVTRAFAGMQIDRDQLTFDPRLPEALRGLRFQVQYRGRRINVSLDHDRLRLVAHSYTNAPGVHVNVAGTHVTLGGGEAREFTLNKVIHQSFSQQQLKTADPGSTPRAPDR